MKALQAYDERLACLAKDSDVESILRLTLSASSFHNDYQAPGRVQDELVYDVLGTYPHTIQDIVPNSS